MLADPEVQKIRKEAAAKLRGFGAGNRDHRPADRRSPQEPATTTSGVAPMQIIGVMGPAGAAYTKEIAGLLADPREEVRAEAVAAIDRRGNKDGDLALQAACLNALNRVKAEAIPDLRMHLRLWAGDNADMQRSVTWLGKPAVDPVPKTGLPPAEARAVLSLFARLWDQSANLGGLCERSWRHELRKLQSAFQRKPIPIHSDS